MTFNMDGQTWTPIHQCGHFMWSLWNGALRCEHCDRVCGVRSARAEVWLAPVRVLAA